MKEKYNPEGEVVKEYQKKKNKQEKCKMKKKQKKKIRAPFQIKKKAQLLAWIDWRKRRKNKIKGGLG